MAVAGYPPDLQDDEGSRTFPREARLTEARDFGLVFRRARRSTDPAFSILARSNSVGRSRLGLAISRKCARRNVDRNRIKRLIRESFRHRRQQLPALDYVVMCRPAVLTQSNAELFHALDLHWSRLSPP